MTTYQKDRAGVVSNMSIGINGSPTAGFIWSFCRECGIIASPDAEPVVQRLIYLAQRYEVILKQWPDFDWIDDSWPSSKKLSTDRQALAPKMLPTCSDELTGRIKQKLMPLFSLKPKFAKLEDWIIALARISYCAERGIDGDEAVESVLSTLERTGYGTLTPAEHNAMLCIARDVLAERKLLFHGLSLINPKTSRSNLEWNLKNKP